MKALVLASSDGRALRPLTLKTPPALLPVAAKPLLLHTLEGLAAAGIDDVTVAVSAHADLVRTVVGDGARWGLRARCISMWPEETATALVGRVRSAAPAEDWLVVHASVLRSPTMLTQVLDAAATGAAAHLAVSAGGTWAGLDWIRHDAPAAIVPDDPERPAHWQSSGVVMIARDGAWPVASLANYHAVNLRAVDAGVPDVILPGLERVAGVWVGRHAVVPGASILAAPVLTGAEVHVHSDAQLAGDVVLSDHVMIDRGATLARTVVLPYTYIGEGVDLRNAIVSGGTLIRVDTGSVTHVTDRFLIADIARTPVTAAAGAIFSRLAGAALVVASAPLWPLALAAGWRRDRAHPIRRATLLGNHTVAGEGGARVPAPFATFEFAAAAPLLRYLPRVLAVLSGDLRVVGVAPRPPASRLDVPDEWERVRDEAPAGLLGPRQIAGASSDDDALLLEAVYARTRSRWNDLVWVGRALRALVTPQLRRLAGETP